jgi:hypothetical protein
MNFKVKGILGALNKGKAEPKGGEDEVVSMIGTDGAKPDNGLSVLKETTSQRTALDWGVIHPLLPWRLAFDYFLMVLIVYSLIVVPYRLAFDVPAVGAWLAFELTVDGFFLVDILLNFNTAIFVGEELIGKRQTITKKYLRGWFAVDFLSTIPFDFIVDAILQTTAGNNELKWFRLARLLKLVRKIKRGSVPRQSVCRPLNPEFCLHEFPEVGQGLAVQDAQDVRAKAVCLFPSLTLGPRVSFYP